MIEIAAKAKYYIQLLGLDDSCMHNVMAFMGGSNEHHPMEVMELIGQILMSFAGKYEDCPGKTLTIYVVDTNEEGYYAYVDQATKKIHISKKRSAEKLREYIEHKIADGGENYCLFIPASRHTNRYEIVTTR